MNLKLAKQLRRMAEKMSIGLPALKYEKYSPAEYKTYSFGSGLVSHTVRTKAGVPCRLAPSTRKIYKQLKNEVRK